MQKQETLKRLKRRLSLTDNGEDELLSDLLADAESLVKGYTGRRSLPEGGGGDPGPLDGIVRKLAAMEYNHLGAEGENSRTEGGISLGICGLSKDEVAMLNACRIGKAGL